MLLLAPILALREYRHHKAEKAAIAKLNFDVDAERSEKDIAYMEHQGPNANADAYHTPSGCCGRQYSTCSICGRAKASSCHQRKCYRRQYGGGCCGRKRRVACGPATAAVYPRANGAEAGYLGAQEQGMTDHDPETAYGGYLGELKPSRGPKATEKEFEAGYADDYGGRVEKDSELPPYKG